jgi:hypothetical protein
MSKAENKTGHEFNGKFCIGTTPAGKELYVAVAKGTSLYKLEFASGGELPSDLQGNYTSISEAEMRGRSYLASKHTSELTKPKKHKSKVE